MSETWPDGSVGKGSKPDRLSLISGIRIIEERTDSCKFSSDHTHAPWHISSYVHTHAQTLTKENVIKIEKNVQVQDCFIADVG